MLTKMYAEEAIIRRRQARRSDRDRLRTERWIPGGFAWRERYNAKYVLAYAVSNGWNKSRLRTAIDAVDEKKRMARNAKLRRR